MDLDNATARTSLRIVLLDTGHGKIAYLFEDKDLAYRFAEFMKSEVDGCEVIPVRSALGKMLAWYAARPGWINLGATSEGLVWTDGTLHAVPYKDDIPHNQLEAMHKGSDACPSCYAENPAQYNTFPTVCPHRIGPDAGHIPT